ncbi:DnaA ATPase domain-containing protein [Streptomyces fenghuangensis]
MHSTSEPPTPQEMWLQERLDAALARFDKHTPARYSQPVPLPDPARTWAEAGRDVEHSLFLTGPIGVGKTHTAWTTVRTWLAACFTGTYRGNPVIAIHRSTALFDALRPEGDNPRGVQKAAQEADLLFIDDLAAARVSPTGWTQERLYELFDERYVQRRPVLITCDVLPGDLGDIVGPRVASRLAEMCRGGVHLMEGPDRRKGGAQ